VVAILANLLTISLKNVSKFAQTANSAIQAIICAKVVPPIVPNVLVMIWLLAHFVHRSSIAMIKVVLIRVIKLCSPVMLPENVNHT